MSDETTKIGTALRAHKGPADAVIRTVSLDEFPEGGGEAVRDYPGANKVGGPGGAGSTAGIRVGARDSEGKPIGPAGGQDAKVVENLARRNARNRVAAQTRTAATLEKPPVQTPSQAVQDDGLEDWERPSTEPQKAVQPRPATTPAQAGDQLAVAQANALALLQAIPDGMELYVGGNGLGPDGVSMAMGIGFMIAAGHAVYRGDGHYRITPAGRAAGLGG